MAFRKTSRRIPALQSENPAFSLRRAAAFVGLNRHSLKVWLSDAGYKFPKLRRGSKLRISKHALTRAMQTHEVTRKRGQL